MIENEFYKMLGNKSVKDLYWLLFSDCPINNNHPELSKVPFFPSAILLEWRDTSEAYFQTLDQNPNDLEHFLDRTKNRRLGFYAEALLSYFFQTFPKIELLLQNYQLVQQKRTVGEVDFIIKWKSRVIHLECAVKYYLFDHSKDVNQLENWIGPSCNDNLGRKIGKVLNLQLPLIKSPSITKLVDELDMESYLFLKGKLFVNSDVNCQWINSGRFGKYCFLSQLKAKTKSGLSAISKPFWLSALGEKELESSQLNSEIEFNRRAELVYSALDYPFFVAPDGWPFT